MTETDFSHDNASAIVRFKDRVIASHNGSVWIPIACNDSAVDRAVRSAIWTLPNGAGAEDMRREIASLAIALGG